MHHTKTRLFCLFTALLVVGQSQALNIHCGQLFDSEAGEFKANQWISTGDDGRFSEVRAHRSGDPVDVDLSAAWCLPGLMDMHTHLSQEFNPMIYLQGFQMNPADLVLQATVFARRTLEAGFTTVRDLGDSDNITVSLRKAIDKGWVTGPRIFTAAKAIGTTGGHADPTNGVRAGLLPMPGPKYGVVNGVAEARQAVRKRYQDGADLIKITATGGVLSQASSGDNAQFFDDELKAIVDTARDYGFKVTAHAHGKEGMKRAILAGVASIEHGTYLDEEIIRLMKRHGTYLVPTLVAGQWVTDKAAVDGFFPPVVQGKAATIGPIIAGSFARAHKAGVNIAFGTDSGVSAHGHNAKEFGIMVDHGMRPAEALQAATLMAARLLGQEAHLGQVKSGYFADLVAVSADPLQDIRRMESVQTVIKNGQVIKHEHP